MNAPKLPAHVYQNLLGLNRVPHDFYELLEISPLEADAQRIESALRRAAHRLKATKADADAGEWRALANHLEAANQTLLEPDRKRAYDQGLERREVPETSPSPSNHDLDPMAPVPLIQSIEHSSVDAPSLETNEYDITITPSPVKTPQRRAKSVSPKTAARRALMTAFAAFVTLIVCFVGVLQFRVLPNRSQRQRTPVKIPQSSTELPLPPATNNTKQPAKRQTAVEAISLNHTTPQPSTTSPQPLSAQPTQQNNNVATNLDAPQKKQLYDWVVSTQKALRERRLSDAATSVRQAVTLAAGTPHESRIARLDQWTNYVHQFWQAYESGLSDLAGTDLIVDGQRVHIVDVTEDMLIVKAFGKIERFAKRSPPPRYAFAIADRWFDSSAASTPVFHGAYLLSTEDPDLSEVRALWQQATNRGATLGGLPVILDDTYDDLVP